MARETCRAAGQNEACRAIWLPSLIAWYYNLHYGAQSVFYLTTKFHRASYIKLKKEKKRKTESERGKNGERQARRKNIQRATKFLRNRIQVNPGIHSIFLFGSAIHFLPVERDSNAAFFFFIASLLKKKIFHPLLGENSSAVPCRAKWKAMTVANGYETRSFLLFYRAKDVFVGKATKKKERNRFVVSL